LHKDFLSQIILAKGIQETESEGWDSACLLYELEMFFLFLKQDFGADTK
jgi:hypothetical protein